MTCNCEFELPCSKVSTCYLDQEIADKQEDIDSLTAECVALRKLVAEARRLIVARGESTDWPLQVHQHRFLATCNELGIAMGESHD